MTNYEEYAKLSEGTRVYFRPANAEKIVYGHIVRVAEELGGKHAKSWWSNRVLIDGENAPRNIFWGLVQVARNQSK